MGVGCFSRAMKVSEGKVGDFGCVCFLLFGGRRYVFCGRFLHISLLFMAHTFFHDLYILYNVTKPLKDSGQKFLRNSFWGGG